MSQSALFLTVLCSLAVLNLTTTAKVQWIKCIDDSCLIEYPYKFSTTCRKGLSDCTVKRYRNLDESSSVKFLLDEDPDRNSLTLKMNFPGTAEQDQLISIEDYDSNILFVCGPVVKTAAYNIIYPTINGTEISINGKVYCSWSIDLNNATFPYELIDPPKYYISERGYQVYYNLTQTVPVAPANYSQLPKSVEPFVDGYQYQAVGSEKYLLVARVGNETTDFMLKVNEETPKLVSVNLKNDISIDIECDFSERNFTPYAKFYVNKINLFNIIRGKIDGDECRWSIPDSFKTFYGPVNFKQTAYALQIIENNRFVYFDENNFRVATPTSASSSSTLTKSLLIVVLFSLIFS